MLARRFAIPFMLLVVVAGMAGALYAQLETGERGIPPLATSDTLEIGGIHVDVGGADAQKARYAGWRIAQRQAFRLLWAKMHDAPVNQAPTLSSLPNLTLNENAPAQTVSLWAISPGGTNQNQPLTVIDSYTI